MQIIVEITLTATNASFDFLLPLERPICEILPDIAEQIEYVDKTAMLDKSSQQLLCDMDRRLLLNPTKSLSELGVRNGAHLMLC